MRGPSVDDEEAWANARAALDRLPAESPEKRAERLRRTHRLTVLAAALGATAVVLLLVVVVLDGGISGPGDVPGWRVATGFAVLVTGSVLMFVAIAGQSRAVRHLRGWRGPLDWLTRAERRQLLRQARGTAPLEPKHVPLARHVARAALVGGTLAPPAAMLLAWTGWVLVAPGTVPFVLVAGMVLLGLPAVLYERWDSRRLQRFLDEHPDP